MKSNTAYQRVASYEAKPGEVERCLLLFSGGLDTSVMIPWLKESYECEVVTLTFNLGQQNDDLEAIRQKALKLGAIKAITLDVRAEFADDFLAPAIKANASYQGNYHLSTPLGRACIGRKAAQLARAEGCQAVAHGSTGKGNDQVRFDSYIITHDAAMKIIAPVREWRMDRDAEIDYAIKHNIPVPVRRDFPYSVDDNMWGMTWEGGEIEEPDQVAPIEKFLTTYTLAKNAPDQEQFVKIGFVQGVPCSIDGHKLELFEIVERLNHIGGRHGVGVVHIVEDRLVGLKDRGVYEQPGGHILINAHRALERYVSTRVTNEIKEMLDIKWAYLCYGALWYDPAMQAINAFNDSVNAMVSGVVTLKLYKGKLDVVALESENALGFASFNTDKGHKFNENSSAGFIEVYSQQMRQAFLQPGRK